jgi:hypothetical protein
VPRGRPTREAVYLRLRTQIDELWQRMGGLPDPVEAAGIWQGIWYEEAHHSTAIEGNTLVLKQVEQLLAEGRAVGDKALAEYMEVRGYADAADWVYRQAHRDPAESSDTLTLTEVRRIHAVAMEPVWRVSPHPEATEREGPGSFREHDIHAFPGGMRPPTWPLVPSLMATWLTDASHLDPRATDFPEQLARLHRDFELVHPFLDGNGRTGRLVLNLVLVRLGYPPAIVYKNDRAKYLMALRRADSGDYGALGELLARAILDNLYKFVIKAVAGPARLVPIAALADRRIGHAALRAAAVRGRLRATKGPDGQWRSSRNWVNEYLRERHRRLP